MGFDLRLLVVACASFAIGSLTGSVVVPWLASRVGSGLPAARARGLLLARALPLALATASLALAVISFLVFEPRQAEERMGLVLLTLAALSAVFLVSGMVRLVRYLRLAARLERHWLATADPISLHGLEVPAFAVSAAFPIVALIGLVRPRLIVARSVLSACSPDELRAIAAHERGHMLRRDNLSRAILTLAPDALAWLPIGRRLDRAWHDAAEEAADDFATSLGEHGRLTLAEALIRVARLAPRGSSAMGLPASALYRGENIDSRVRRLLGPQATALPAPSFWWRAAASAAFLGTAVVALHAIHELLEAAVTFLP